MTHTYFFNFTPTWGAFLTENGYDFTCSDADIIAVRLPLANDDRFIQMVIEYTEWLETAQHDMTINPKADGSKYHR